MTMKVYSAVLLLSLGMEMTVGLHALPALTAGKSLPVTFEWGGGVLGGPQKVSGHSRREIFHASTKNTWSVVWAVG